MTPPQYQDKAVVGVSYSNAVARRNERQAITMYSIMKRSIDIVGSLVGLMLLSPLFIIIAILIKWEDPKGSVFFYQTRIGKNEKPFRMFKFRSMLTGAED